MFGWMDPQDGDARQNSKHTHIVILDITSHIH